MTDGDLRPKQHGRGNRDVSIILPFDKKKGNLLEESEHEREVFELVEKLARQSGGATTVPAVGFWSVDVPKTSATTSKQGSWGGTKLCKEKVTVVNVSKCEITGEEEEDNNEDAVQATCAYDKEEDSFGEPLGEISITVPSTYDKENTLTKEEHDKYVMEVIKRLTEVTGRITAVPAVGFWLLEGDSTIEEAAAPHHEAECNTEGERRLMRERVTIVTASCFVDDRVRCTVKQTAKWLATALGQEAVFVKVNNRAYLIRGHADQHNSTTISKKKNKQRLKRLMASRRLMGTRFHLFKITDPGMVYDCNYQAK